MTLLSRPRGWLVAALCLASALALADDRKLPDYQSMDEAGVLSYEGYQDMRIGASSWYVAYQGNRSTPTDWIDSAWSARAAQVCQSVGLKYFVALRYPMEPVTPQDDIADSRRGAWDGWSQRDVAGFIPIPIYTPSAAPQVVTGPSKLGTVRCLSDPQSLKDPQRAVAVDQALRDARAAGVAVH